MKLSFTAVMSLRLDYCNLLLCHHLHNITFIHFIASYPLHQQEGAGVSTTRSLVVVQKHRNHHKVQSHRQHLTPTTTTWLYIRSH